MSRSMAPPPNLSYPHGIVPGMNMSGSPRERSVDSQGSCADRHCARNVSPTIQHGREESDGHE